MSRNADPADLVQGRVIASKYRLEQAIGRGGMGIVFRATHLELSFSVAIKVLTSDVDSADARDRFLREARAAAQIRSEHAARVFDLGSLPSGAPFIVMECLEGINLRQYLRQRGKAPVDHAVSFVVQACRAVAEAHGLGIVHRDIKPSNLFLCERDNAPPVVKVLDFGISKTLGGGAPSSATTGAALVGSPQYMSPERLRSSAKVDPTVDVWAFGAVLYELLSGTPAFSGETVPALLASIVADEPTPLTTLVPGVPRHVADVVDKCLHKDPLKRYANALELLQALVAQPVTQSPEPLPRAGHGSSNEYTKVQPGFTDTTVLLSPSDIELLSEPQPPTTTTIEPITKDATARTRAKQTLVPNTATRGMRGRSLVLAGLAAFSVAVSVVALRSRSADRETAAAQQQNDELRPLGTSSPEDNTSAQRPPVPALASITRLDELPAIEAEGRELPPSTPVAEEDGSKSFTIQPTKLERRQSSGKDKRRTKTDKRKTTPASPDTVETRPPSAAKQPKKPTGTELFSDIH